MKIHFYTCYGKQLEKTKEPITQRKNDISLDNSTLTNSRSNDITYDPRNFDFVRQKWKCEFCNSYFKDLKAKPYANHLDKYHPRPVNSFINLISDDYFTADSIAADDELIEQSLSNPSWLNELNFSMIEKKFNALLINVNSINGFNKKTGISAILDSSRVDMLIVLETKLGDETPPTEFEYLNYNTIRRDRTSGGGGILIFVKKGY